MEAQNYGRYIYTHLYQSFNVEYIYVKFRSTLVMCFLADKIIDWRGNKGEELLHKYKETEIMWTRTKTREHGFDETVKEYKQKNMESDKETNGVICETERFGVMNSPYENRIIDLISKSDANIFEDHGSSSTDNNININVGSWWFQEIMDFEEFSCSLWS